MRKMKIPLTLLIIAASASSFVFAQTIAPADLAAEKQIIALERAGWQAWKNKEAAWFRANTTADFLAIDSNGIMTKAQNISSLAEYDVKSYAIDGFRFTMLDRDAALMTYDAMQDAVCSGQQIPRHIRVAVLSR